MKRLIDQKQLPEEEVSRLQDNVFRILNEEFDNSKEYVPSTRDWLAAYWAGFKGPEQLSRIRNTGYVPLRVSINAQYAINVNVY